MALRSDGEGVIVAGGYGGDVWWKTHDWGRLIGIKAHTSLGHGNAQSPVGSVPEAHHCCFVSGGHPSAGQPGYETREGSGSGPVLSG